MKILILGASGMLGSALYKNLKQTKEVQVFGTCRNSNFGKKNFPFESKKLLVAPKITDPNCLTSVLDNVKPDVVINCIGVIKQKKESNDLLGMMPINAIFPHQLQRCCEIAHARLIHISTDCVFSGSTGNYNESDKPDPVDLYGQSKLLGEDLSGDTIILRTSFIGHEIGKAHSLVDWFLAQDGTVNGFTKAIFSGLTTIEMVRVIQDFVIPNPKLKGLYHVSANPISKYDLLSLVAETYQKDIIIHRQDKPVIDRSLDSIRFRKVTNYKPPSWHELIKTQYENFHNIQNFKSNSGTFSKFARPSVKAV